VLLSGAGFDLSQLPLFQASLKMLSVAHSLRVQSSFDKTEAEIAFANGMPAAKSDKVVLLSAARYVVATSEDKEAKRIYDAISKRDTNISVLQGNLSLVKFLRKYAAIASQVRPAGVAVDDDFLESWGRRHYFGNDIRQFSVLAYASVPSFFGAGHRRRDGAGE
jgi:hypothetical protein